MQIEQARTLFTLRAIRGFIDDNAAKLGTLVASGRTKKLDGVIASLSDHAAEQDSIAYFLAPLRQHERMNRQRVRDGLYF